MKRKKDYSNLPERALALISDSLANLRDQCRFRTLSTSMGRTLPPQSQLRAPLFRMPWLLVPYQPKSSIRSFLSLVENKIYQFESGDFADTVCYGCSYGFLALVDGVNAFLLDPVRKMKINLPTLTSLPDVLVYVEDEELYKVEHVVGFGYMSRKEMRDDGVAQILLSGNPRDRNCWAVLRWTFDIVTRFAFCKVGDNAWTGLEFMFYRSNRMIFHKGHLHAIDIAGELIVCDLHSPETTLVRVNINSFENGHPWYLSTLEGDIICIFIKHLFSRDDWNKSNPLLLANCPREGRRSWFNEYDLNPLLLADYHPSSNPPEAEANGDVPPRVSYYDLNPLLLAHYPPAEARGNRGIHPRISYNYPHISCHVKNMCIKVYKLNTVEERLDEVRNIADMALFLSSCCCLCLPSNVGGYKSNDIFFPEVFHIGKGISTRIGYDLCRFNLEKRELHPIVSLPLRGDLYDEDEDFSRAYLLSMTTWFLPSDEWVQTAKIWMPTTPCPLIRTIHTKFDFPGPLDPKELEMVQRANLSQKMELYIWNVACGVPPRRGIISEDNMCPFCNGARESVDHLFLQCRFAQEIWRNTRWPECTRGREGVKMLDFIGGMINSAKNPGFSSLEAKKFLLFLGLYIDRLWESRDKVLQNAAIANALAFSQTLNSDYKDSLKRWYFGRVAKPSILGWIPPVMGVIKANFGHVFGLNFTMLAVTFKDHEGRHRLVWTEKISICDHLMAEAQAAWLAACVAAWLAGERDFKNLVLEGTDEGIIEYLKLEQLEPPSMISDLIHRTRGELRKLESSSAVCVHPDINLAINRLASWATFYEKTGLIKEEWLPPCVLYSDAEVCPLDLRCRDGLVGRDIL